MNYTERCEFLCNGQEAINLAKQLIDEAISSYDSSNRKIMRPIALILLDFQMPQKTGIDVIKEVRRFIKMKNDILDGLKV